MADVTAPGRDTEKQLSPYEFVLEPGVVVGETIYKGALVQLSTAGLAIQAGGANPKIVIGRALETVETAVAADTIRVEQGIFKWDNLAGDPVEVADIGSPCYVTDDQTVHQTDGGTDLIAGTVVGVDDDGVWVLTKLPEASGITAA